MKEAARVVVVARAVARAVKEAERGGSKGGHRRVSQVDETKQGKMNLRL